MPRLSLLRLVVLVSSLIPVDSLNAYIDSYSTLNYRPLLDRRKRALDDSSPVHIRFKSHSRTFHLRLIPIDEDENVFAQSHALDIDGVDDAHLRPHHFLYQGVVDGDPGSQVYGSILDGVFDGHIHLSSGDSFTVDKVSRYFPVGHRPSNYHSIVYSDKEINHEKWRAKRDIEGHHACGLNDHVKAQMETLQSKQEPQYSHHFEDSFPYRYLNRDKRDLVYSEMENVRGQQLYRVRTCSMYLQADQKLYEHVYEKEGNRDAIRTREEIVSLFYNHIKAVNHIYETTNFNGVTGLNFVIQRTSIYTPETCDKNRAADGSDNPFCEENVDVSNFLNLNSQRNHSAFCLAYALTYRDFVGGTLGLAWVASPNINTAGGVCQIYQKYNEGMRGWVHRSLNTGIITFVNYGNRVPTRVSQLTLAHEIGHNFGSPVLFPNSDCISRLQHDFPAECQPGLPDGNFIMFASATSGDKVNNARFSACSIANISQVLFEVLKQLPVDPQKHLSSGYGKRNCFQQRTSAFCGNQIKEPGEECDCGFSDKDCAQMGDTCCVPHEIDGVIGQGGGGCKRVRFAKCSPSEGQCCNPAECAPYSESSRRLCRDDTECLNRQFCDGTGPECPDSRPKEDGLACQDATKVCQGGSCNGSVCVQVGLRDCFLTEGPPERLCHLACEKAGKCVSSFELEEFATGRRFEQKGRSGKPGLVLHPGSPCNNYKGYCDIFRKCRSVDSNGPLARLKNLLFNKQTIKTVSQWVQENWWAVVLLAVALLLFMALFIKCCAVHTPSTNPNKPPAQSIYETLRRPQTLIRRGARGAAQPAQRGRPASRPVHLSPSASTPSTCPPPSAPPLAAVLIASPSSAPNVIVVEPPPPYSATTDPAMALGGPKRGHRKKKRNELEMKAKNRRS